MYYLVLKNKNPQKSKIKNVLHWLPGGIRWRRWQSPCGPVCQQVPEQWRVATFWIRCVKGNDWLGAAGSDPGLLSPVLKTNHPALADLLSLGRKHTQAEISHLGSALDSIFSRAACSLSSFSLWRFSCETQRERGEERERHREEVLLLGTGEDRRVSASSLPRLTSAPHVRQLAGASGLGCMLRKQVDEGNRMGVGSTTGKVNTGPF